MHFVFRQMTRLQIQTYGKVRVFFRRLNAFNVGEIRSFYASPDDGCALLIESRADHLLQIDNSNNIDFDFAIEADNRRLASIQYARGIISINGNWLIREDSVENQAIREETELLPSTFMTIELNNFNAVKNSRLDLRLNGGHFAALVFSRNELLFVRFNGIYVFGRLNSFFDEMLQLPRVPIMAAVENVVANEPIPNNVSLCFYGSSFRIDFLSETGFFGVFCVDLPFTNSNV